MANKYANKEYFRVDTASVKNAGVGGRILNVKIDVELPNGVLGGVEAGTIEGNSKVKQFNLPTSETAKTLVPVLIFKPEINYDESRSVNKKLGYFRNEAGSFTEATPLEQYDMIHFSTDYFTKTGNIAKGDVFVMDENGLLVYADGSTINANDYKTTFVVTNIKKSWVATYVGSTGNRLPQPYELITVEVNIA